MITQNAHPVFGANCCQNHGHLHWFTVLCALRSKYTHTQCNSSASLSGKDKVYGKSVKNKPLWISCAHCDLCNMAWGYMHTVSHTSDSTNNDKEITIPQYLAKINFIIQRLHSVWISSNNQQGLYLLCFFSYLQLFKAVEAVKTEHTARKPQEYEEIVLKPLRSRKTSV